MLNEGQLDWLPSNPRTWTATDLDRTKQSLVTDPDFQEDKPILVVALPEGKLLVFAGNLRTTAAKALALETFEAIQYTPESAKDRTTIKRRAVLDNGSFGSWDMDALANEWSDLPLLDFGVPAWDTEKGPEGYGTEFNLPSGDAPASNQITFYFAAEQKEFIENALDQATEAEDTYGNDNKTGNKLYQIVKEWVESRT